MTRLKLHAPREFLAGRRGGEAAPRPASARRGIAVKKLERKGNYADTLCVYPARALYPREAHTGRLRYAAILRDRISIRYIRKQLREQPENIEFRG